MLRMVSADGQVDNRIMDTSTLPGRTLRMVGLTIGGLVVGVMAAYVVFMAMLTWLLGSLSW
jgi:hypothetical protein